MRTVVLYSLMSLDGVAESPETFAAEFDETMDANLRDLIGRQDTVLLGRQMYDEWASYWPSAGYPVFADFINNVEKYVFTSTRPPVDWTGTTVVTSDALDVVRDLKTRPGGDIGVHGSLRLTRSLLAAGLIDRMRLVVFPALAGGGRKLFDETVAGRVSLRQSTSTPSGGVLLDYDVHPL
ncbi:dihydrofolate reductase family protein [Actinoplanes sp. M2I2]|uniref:dihydrofolate reductase family protein n=1 Tax=Actinoplanes sp. M2I2 TaxID=1734444 RepID=UPI00202110FA|nr:dihydrofolate reductase family protein [Actinoplanes sp. M2I2]